MPLKSVTNQSPAWEKPKDIMKRHVNKRKSSKCLVYSNVKKTAPSSLLTTENSSTNASSTENSQSGPSEPLNPFKNLSNSPIKRPKCEFTIGEPIYEGMRLIDWEGKSQKSVTSNCPEGDSGATLDWEDDTMARSSFDNNCSFVRRSCNTAASSQMSSFEEKFSQERTEDKLVHLHMRLAWVCQKYF